MSGYKNFPGTEAERNSVTSRKVSNLKYTDVPDGLSNYWAAVNSLLSQTTQSIRFMCYKTSALSRRYCSFGNT